MSDAHATLVPKFELLLEGAPVPSEVLEAIIVVRARQDLEMADLLEVRLSNLDLRWTEEDTFKEGKKLAFKCGFQEGAAPRVLVSGEIVRRECEFPVRGPAVVTVVAMDRRHRLKRGAKSRTFLNKKDSEVASQIAAEVGLSAEVEDSRVVHPYLLQNAQSDLAFLRERAARIGYEVRVDNQDQKLVFKRATTQGAPVQKLTWGLDLHSFQGRVTTEEQVSKVVVRGWRMESKEKVVGTASGGQAKRYDLDGAEPGHATAARTFGQREVLVVDLPVDVPGEATARALARLERYAADFAQASLSGNGHPGLEPGVLVEVDGCGARVNGSYYVSSTLHYLEPRLGYTTHCEVVRSTQTASAPPPAPLPRTLPPRAGG